MSFSRNKVILKMRIEVLLIYYFDLLYEDFIILFDILN